MFSLLWFGYLFPLTSSSWEIKPILLMSTWLRKWCRIETNANNCLFLHFLSNWSVVGVPQGERCRAGKRWQQHSCSFSSGLKGGMQAGKQDCCSSPDIWVIPDSFCYHYPKLLFKHCESSTTLFFFPFFHVGHMAKGNPFKLQLCGLVEMGSN